MVRGVGEGGFKVETSCVRGLLGHRQLSKLQIVSIKESRQSNSLELTSE